MAEPWISQIGPGHAGLRLDAYLASQIEGWSRARLQQLIENEDVVVNGKVAKPSYKLREDDEIEVELIAPPADFFAPENIPIDVVYEDEPLAAVTNPAGLVHDRQPLIFVYDVDRNVFWRKEI